jgi:integrase
MLRWAVENELAEPSVYEGCKAVTGLRRGRSEARESAPVKPVPLADVEAVKPYLSAELWAMIQLQLVTGMRPGEACIMRLADIDRSADAWAYKPKPHKTQHHGRERIVFLGPKAQVLIQPFLTADRERYLFSPQNAEADRNAERRENRQSPMTPSRANRRRTEIRGARLAYCPSSHCMEWKVFVPKGEMQSSRKASTHQPMDGQSKLRASTDFRMLESL